MRKGLNHTAPRVVKRAEIVDGIMAGSSSIRQSKTIVARSVDASEVERSRITDAHRDGKRFVVRADDKLGAFAELEAEISHVQASAEPVAAYQARPYKNLIKLRYNSANCLKQVIFCANSPEHKR
jgi:hypothetical protein